MLLRDAINIPTEVRQGDLVFKLTDATENTADTVANYVVTDQLLEAFTDATALVGAAIREHSSKAAFLSGSFGSGKSNFMGMFQLLLDANPDALARPELAPIVQSMNEWRQGQRFLTVPFHLIGAKSLESAIFGTYVDHIRRLHPDAPLPEVFADEPILENAEALRQRMGDDAFFAALDETDGGADDGWGDLGGWDAERFETARRQSGDGEDRRLLVQALLTTLLSAYADGAAANREGYVDIDTGLSAISRHAHGLGYTGVILFLDELILWLMSRMADAPFVTNEASKLSKLVEASDASRPAPLISFIARQRDLRDLVGTDQPGAERLGFINNLEYQAGRFTDIRLNDSNLPVVAHHRLLRPASDTGAEALKAAFESLNLSDDQRDALRGAEGTDHDFRLTYPFSPAFLSVVVDVAGALQRTRTGLRVLLDLLVRNRDTLEIGHLVPVGDLFDVLDESDEPLSDAMRPQFEAARRIYRSTLRPILLSEHGLTEETIAAEGVTEAFRTDDRLIKTLLLAALVPLSQPFQNLTARKLVALNHGLISTPIPGMEVTAVVNKLQGWAARAGELQLGGNPNDPTVNLVLSEIDTRSILDSVSNVDSPGNRRNLIRNLIGEELGVDLDELMQTTTHLWRGHQRTADLVFGNIRDTAGLPDSHFASSGDNWKIVIDFPFDEDGYNPNDDLARIESLRHRGNDGRTLCWIPSFFTADMRAQLGTLVRLNHLLPAPGRVSDGFREATRHLSQESREAARPQLETQQRAVRNRLVAALKQAYGIHRADPSIIDSSHALSDHFVSLIGGLTLRAPIASTLREALEAVFEQALEYSYPAAPRISGEVRVGEVRTVLDVCRDALEAPDDRIPQVPSAQRKPMARIANELQLGIQSEQAFTLDISPRWDPHFTRKLAERERSGVTGNVTVRELRTWIDEPKPMGLSRQLQNLVIIVWASATDRQFTDHGGPANVSIDTLADHYEVVEQELPDATRWTDAVHRAERVLGLAGLSPAPSAVALAKLSNELATTATRHLDAVSALPGALAELAVHLDDAPATRADTATRASKLLTAVNNARSDLDKVNAFLDADISPSAEAIGASLKSAAAVTATIANVDTELLATAITNDTSGAISARLRKLLQADELAMALAPALNELVARARALVFASRPTPTVLPTNNETTAILEADIPSTPTVDTSTTAFITDRGLTRTAAANRLHELRSQLDDGSFGDGPFDIIIRPTDENET